MTGRDLQEYGEDFLEGIDDDYDLPEQRGEVAEYDDGPSLDQWEAYLDRTDEGRALLDRADIEEILDAGDGIFEMLGPNTQKFLVTEVTSDGTPFALHPIVLSFAFDLFQMIGGQAPQGSAVHGGGHLRAELNRLTEAQDRAQRAGNHAAAQRIERQLMRVAGAIES